MWVERNTHLLWQTFIMRWVVLKPQAASARVKPTGASSSALKGHFESDEDDDSATFAQCHLIEEATQADDALYRAGSLVPKWQLLKRVSAH